MLWLVALGNPSGDGSGVCACVLGLNGTANRKLGTLGPSAPCHGSHVTLWQHSIIDSHYHIRFCVLRVEVPQYMCVCRCVCVCVCTQPFCEQHITDLHQYIRFCVCLPVCVYKSSINLKRPVCCIYGNPRPFDNYLGYPTHATGSLWTRKSFRRHSQLHFKQ